MIIEANDNLKSFADEITQYLGFHAHMTIVSNSAVEQLGFDTRNVDAEAALLLFKAKLFTCCTPKENELLAVTLRTMVAADPDETQPALAQLRGYVVTCEHWEKVPKEEMRSAYTVDSETGAELNPPKELIFV